MSEVPIRVRFAPSPTGYLHVGGARTALYNYLFARKNGGQFVVRVEDTDEQRSSDEFLQMQLGDLRWLGLQWDEGPDPETLLDQGPYGPYRQSQRLDIYKKYAESLIQSGFAYYCFLSDAEIEEQREKARQQGRPLQINSPYRNRHLREAQSRIQQGEEATVRFKVPDQSEYRFNDLLRGEVVLPGDMVGDFVILRSGGMPVYNFCCVIDDALMKISHVFRADEHLNNTLRQMMLYDALEFRRPQFGHLSLILGEDKQKLSKRHGATSVHEYYQKGFLKEALVNFLALLGWSHPEEKEIFSLQELTEKFGVERLKSAPAVFDEKKFRWMNSQYIKQCSAAELYQRVLPILKKQGLSLPDDQEWAYATLDALKERMETLYDAVELFRPLLEYHLEDSSKEALSWSTTPLVLKSWKDMVAAEPQSQISQTRFSEIQDRVKLECGVKGKQLFMPIRVAVVGRPQGADLKTLVPLLTKEQLLERVDLALQQVQQ